MLSQHHQLIETNVICFISDLYLLSLSRRCGDFSSRIPAPLKNRLRHIELRPTCTMIRVDILNFLRRRERDKLRTKKLRQLSPKLMMTKTTNILSWD